MNFTAMTKTNQHDSKEKGGLTEIVKREVHDYHIDHLVVIDSSRERRREEVTIAISYSWKEEPAYG